MQATGPPSPGGGASPAAVVIYPDGSCLACQWSGPSVDAAFTSNPTLLTAVSRVPLIPHPNRPRLMELGADGLLKKSLMLGPVSDPVWSSRGKLAVVRGGWIWVGRPGKLR